MKRLIQVLITASIILGAVYPANALPFGFGYAKVNLSAFEYSGNVSVYADQANLFSAAYTLALDQDELVSDDIFNRGDKWPVADRAIACTSSACSSAGAGKGYSTSRAAVLAGGEAPGYFSMALAATAAGAYQFYVRDDSDITISIDYYRSQWLDVAGDGGPHHDSLHGTLEITLSGLKAGTTFGAFAYTAAYAATSAGSAPVPEPATMLLLGSGLIGLAGLGRKKFRK